MRQSRLDKIQKAIDASVDNLEPLKILFIEGLDDPARLTWEKGKAYYDGNPVIYIPHRNKKKTA